MIEFFVFWFISGIIAYLCGLFIDKVLFKEKEQAHIFCIICGPLLWLIVFEALIKGIRYANKKKKHLRKYN